MTNLELSEKDPKTVIRLLSLHRVTKTRQDQICELMLDIKNQIEYSSIFALTFRKMYEKYQDCFKLSRVTSTEQIENAINFGLCAGIMYSRLKRSSITYEGRQKRKGLKDNE